MDAISKLLKKISTKDKTRILSALEEIHAGKLSGIKLTGKNEFRVRIGHYRIIYQLKEEKPIITQVRRRNEKTYK